MSIKRVAAGFSAAAALSAATIIAAQNITVEREVTGQNAGFMELGCQGLEPVTFALAERNSACRDDQRWIQIVGLGGKSFDVSHGFDYEALKEDVFSRREQNQDAVLRIVFTDTAWNAALDSLPFDLDAFKTEGPFYIVPDELAFIAE